MSSRFISVFVSNRLRRVKIKEPIAICGQIAGFKDPSRSQREARFRSRIEFFNASILSWKFDSLSSAYSFKDLLWFRRLCSATCIQESYDNPLYTNLTSFLEMHSCIILHIRRATSKVSAIIHWCLELKWVVNTNHKHRTASYWGCIAVHSRVAQFSAFTLRYGALLRSTFFRSAAARMNVWSGWMREVEHGLS
jgi:hypothetical protein